MKTPRIVHPKPPEGWRVTTRKGGDPCIEAYLAYIWESGGCVDVCLHDEDGTEYPTRIEARRAGIQRAHELSAVRGIAEKGKEA